MRGLQEDNKREMMMSAMDTKSAEESSGFTEERKNGDN